MASATNASARTMIPRALETITSRDNRWLKRFHAALAGEPRRRSDEEIVGVEGVRLVETALRSGIEIIALLASSAGRRHLETLSPWVPPTTRILTASDRLFGTIAATEAPQGIAALVRPRIATFDDLVSGLPLVVVLAGVQDPGNVGALLRTGEAFRASGAAICSAGGIGTANPFSPKALRASAGSALRLPVLRGVTMPVLLAQLRIAGVRIYAASPDGATSPTGAASPAGAATQPDKDKWLRPWEADWRVPAALIIGNEGAGLPADLVRSANALVRIPQAVAAGAAAPIDSLNAAVAGGILLYEAARQRGLG